MHYLAPEGAYAINPDHRVREYRTMVEGLHRAGLRMVQDVVFNHTNAVERRRIRTWMRWFRATITGWMRMAAWRTAHVARIPRLNIG